MSSKSEIRNPRAATVLFLCTGNYYRSRWAELRFTQHAAAAGLTGWTADSAGLAVDHEQKWNVGPISTRLGEGLRKHGLIDHAGTKRMPRSVTADDVRAADLVIAMQDREHRPMVERSLPDHADRVEYWDIDDVPPSDAYDPLAIIDAQVGALVQRLRDGG